MCFFCIIIPFLILFTIPEKSLACRVERYQYPFGAEIKSAPIPRQFFLPYIIPSFINFIGMVRKTAAGAHLTL
jgi:hypothetical protein